MLEQYDIQFILPENNFQYLQFKGSIVCKSWLLAGWLLATLLLRGSRSGKNRLNFMKCSAVGETTENKTIRYKTRELDIIHN